MIEFDHVSYSYPGAAQPALSDVCLRVEEGDFVLVVGASGSGKSTLLRCVNGLVPHFHGGSFGGAVRVAGLDTRTHEPRDLAASVGFVFQDPEAQMVVEVVEDELVFGMENLGVEPPIMRRRVEEVLDQLEIAHLRRRRVSSLSGGERQRVAIAAVLAMQPRVLVLDEPTSQLDPHTAEEVLTALQKLNADLGLTIVLSEHRLERVVQYADSMIICERNSGTPSHVSIGPLGEMLEQSPLAPPLALLGRSLGWRPLPLTIKEARRFVVAQGLDEPDEEINAKAQRRNVGPTLASATTGAFDRPVGTTPERQQAARSRSPRLQVRDLSVERGGSEVLHRIGFEVHAGELLAIMGRNGSGKSTLLRAIAGLDLPSRGSVVLDGAELGRLPPEQRAPRIGFVPQDPRALLFRETVADELRWTLGRSGDEARVQRTLESLGLERLAGAHPRDISGGEQQRAALGAILVAGPELLMLDEPTRGLDYTNKQRLAGILEQLRRDGCAIILVTHDVELVAATAERVLLLGDGEVVAAGTPAELLNESLIFSSQVGKLFRNRSWLTVTEALQAIGDRHKTL